MPEEIQLKGELQLSRRWYSSFSTDDHVHCQETHL